jgi:hypothetical protein
VQIALCQEVFLQSCFYPFAKKRSVGQYDSSATTGLEQVDN